MKYVIICTDGAGDNPIPELHNKTAIEGSRMPFTDELASRGEIGIVKTVPDGMSPGSDVANLALMGYNPKIYHTGRSPLEAASIGVELTDTDVAYRCNIVTLSGNGPYETLTMVDHAAGDITTEEATILVNDVAKYLNLNGIHFYPGFSYRHCMIVENGKTSYDLTPPHDILGRTIGAYLPKGEGSEFLYDMMKRSYDFLKDHPVNKARIAAGKNPANTIWLWGLGKKPALSPFEEKYRVKGSAISAVDLIKGIGILAGLDAPAIPGATGTVNTNYEGKADAAIRALSGNKDFVYIHLEGPDESGHQGSLTDKITSLERIDAKIVKPVWDWLKASGEEYRILIAPDHYTPVSIRTHVGNPVPYVFFDSKKDHAPVAGQVYGESAGAQGEFIDDATKLIDRFFA